MFEFDPFAISPGARTILVVALDVALKATALLIMAIAAHAIQGPRRPLARSALWNAVLIGLLLLPVASLASPRLRLAVLPGGETPAATAEARDIAPIGDAAPVAAPPVAPAPISTAIADPIGAREIVADAPSPAPAATPVAPRRFGLAEIIIGAYLAPALLMSLRLAMALRGIARLKRRGGPIAEGAWHERLIHWKGEVGVDKHVDLMASDRISIPVVVGWLRPAILVPRGLAGSASPRVIDAVLLHELGHIRRGDYGWNLARKAVQVLYWPHPLAWPLGRVIGDVRERACDDLCIRGLGGAPAYRASLLEVASGLVRRPGPALGLAMAHATVLGRRLAWIDHSPGASRCLWPRPARWGLGGAVASLAMVVGSIELARAEGRAMPQGEGATFAGRVIERETKQPIAGATVIVSRGLEGAGPGEISPWAGEETLTTDAEGRFAIAFTPEQVAEPRTVIAITRVAHPDFVARLAVPASLASLLRGRQAGELPSFETIALERGVEYFGQVLAPDGEPAAGVRYQFGMFRPARDGFGSITRGWTDPEGRFRLRMPRTAVLEVTLIPERYAPLQFRWGEALPGNTNWLPTEWGSTGPRASSSIATRIRSC